MGLVGGMMSNMMGICIGMKSRVEILVIFT